MHTVYNIEVDCEAVKDNLYRLGNQIFKLLPMREEDKDWRKPLETLIIELLGMGNLFSDQKELLSLVCKLEGLKDCKDADFFLYRRTIFECCSLISNIREECR